MNDELWISDPAFLGYMTGHLNSLNIQLQGKDELITVFDDVRVFRDKRRLWEKQLKMKQFLYFLKLESLKSFSSKCVQESARRIVLL